MFVHCTSEPKIAHAFKPPFGWAKIGCIVANILYSFAQEPVALDKKILGSVDESMLILDKSAKQALTAAL